MFGVMAYLACKMVALTEQGDAHNPPNFAKKPCGDKTVATVVAWSTQHRD